MWVCTDGELRQVAPAPWPPALNMMGCCTGGGQSDLLLEIGHKDLVFLQKHGAKGYLTHFEVEERPNLFELKQVFVVLRAQDSLTAKSHRLNISVCRFENDLSLVQVFVSREIQTDEYSVPEVF